MRYPNLAAEMAHLPNDVNRTWAIRAANVTEEVYQDIMAGIDDFTHKEAITLANYLKKSMNYLFSDTLTEVDLNSEEDFKLLVLLECNLTLLSKRRLIGRWDMHKYKRSKELPAIIRRGEVVSHAELAAATEYISDILHCCQYWSSQPVLRARTVSVTTGGAV